MAKRDEHIFELGDWAIYRSYTGEEFLGRIVEVDNSGNLMFKMTVRSGNTYVYNVAGIKLFKISYNEALVWKLSH
jgi:hypothetical protein